MLAAGNTKSKWKWWQQNLLKLLTFLAESCVRIDHDKCQLKEGTEERDRQAERIVRESRQVRVEQVISQPLVVFVWWWYYSWIFDIVVDVIMTLSLVLMVLFCKSGTVRGSKRLYPNLQIPGCLGLTRSTHTCKWSNQTYNTYRSAIQHSLFSETLSLYLAPRRKFLPCHTIHLLCFGVTAAAQFWISNRDQRAIEI